MVGPIIDAATFRTIGTVIEIFFMVRNRFKVPSRGSVKVATSTAVSLAS